MWIEQLANGKLRAVERYTDPITEKQRKVSVMIEKDTAQQRKKAAAALQIKIQKKTHVNKDKYNITFHEVLDKYMDYKKDVVKESTFFLDSQKKDKLCSIIPEGTLLKNLTSTYVKESINSIDTTQRQKNVYQSFFKSVMRWAYANDYIEDIRFIDKMTPFVKKKKTIIDKSEKEILDKKMYLEAAELKLLISKFRMQHTVDLTTWLALTGIRIGEAIALEFSDIDLEKRIIHINKNYGLLIDQTITPKSEDSIRDIYIQDELLPLAKRLKSEAMQNYLITKCPLLFHNKGQRIKYSSYYHTLKDWGEKLGWDIHPHLFRHTHVALLAENGMSLDEISRRLGHSDSITTKRIYYHVTNKLKDMENNKLKKITIL